MKSIHTKMNGLDLCLEVVSRSCQVVNHRATSALNILETIRDIEAWFHRTSNRKWHMGYQMVTLSMTSRNPERSNS